MNAAAKNAEKLAALIADRAPSCTTKSGDQYFDGFAVFFSRGAGEKSHACIIVRRANGQIEIAPGCQGRIFAGAQGLPFAAEPTCAKCAKKATPAARAKFYAFLASL